MKFRQLASLFLLLIFGSISQSKAQSEGAILGRWLNTEKTAHIEIEKSGSVFLGKIIWLANPSPDGKPATDRNNSNEKLRSRPLIGLSIIDGLKYEKGVWKDGEIYDPNSGKTYSCELKLLSDEILEVKGYLGFSFVGKTVEWTRIK
jgi:uncharacterized protein (DUF2147 family)